MFRHTHTWTGSSLAQNLASCSGLCPFSTLHYSSCPVSLTSADEAPKLTCLYTDFPQRSSSCSLSHTHRHTRIQAHTTCCSAFSFGASSAKHYSTLLQSGVAVGRIFCLLHALPWAAPSEPENMFSS